MLLALVVSVVALAANPLTPLAGTEVATIVPVPAGAKLAPDPTNIVAPLFVPPCRVEKLGVAAAIADRTDCSVGTLLSDPGVAIDVTTDKPLESAVPVVLLNCGMLPVAVNEGATIPLPPCETQPYTPVPIC